jgi:hypothetical protein
MVTQKRRTLLTAITPRLCGRQHGLHKSLHILHQRMLPGLSGPTGRAGPAQIASFLASHVETICTPEPARFFEVPNSLPLPEDFSHIR